jgi:DNA 3'-phosphatase
MPPRTSYVIHPPAAPAAAAAAAAAKKLYMFDLDGTLLTASDGRKIALGTKIIQLGCVGATFDRLGREGYTVAIMTNQALWNVETRMKIDLVRLTWPQAWVCVATGKDSPYRKPGRALYDVLLEQLGWDAAAVEEVHYCGDAVGEAAVFPPYRWASSDWEFARAIDAEFHTPLELFLPAPPIASRPEGETDIVLTVGVPGSGKSTTTAALAAAGYTVVAETSVAKTVAKVAEVWAAGARRIVVDGTHPSGADRDAILASVDHEKVRIAWHIRDGRPFNALRPDATRVPEIAYNIYVSKFVSPMIHGVPVVLVY